MKSKWVKGYQSSRRVLNPWAVPGQRVLIMDELEGIVIEQPVPNSSKDETVFQSLRKGLLAKQLGGHVLPTAYCYKCQAGNVRQKEAGILECNPDESKRPENTHSGSTSILDSEVVMQA